MSYLDQVVLWIAILALAGSAIGTISYMILGKGPYGGSRR